MIHRHAPGEIEPPSPVAFASLEHGNRRCVRLRRLQRSQLGPLELPRYLLGDFVDHERGILISLVFPHFGQIERVKLFVTALDELVMAHSFVEGDVSYVMSSEETKH